MKRLLVLLSAGLLVAAQAEDPQVVRRSSVGGWTVTYFAESDGGRLVELARDGRGFSIRYSANFWRGNGGELRGAAFTYSDCASGDETRIDPDRRPGPADFRRQFASYSAECALSEWEQARLLRGLEPAYCLFDRWAAEAEAETANEIADIVAYGSGETPAPVRPDPPADGCR